MTSNPPAYSSAASYTYPPRSKDPRLQTKHEAHLFSEVEHERTCQGVSFAVVGALWNLLEICFFYVAISLNRLNLKKLSDFTLPCRLLVSLFAAIFYIWIIFSSKYLSGKPNQLRLWPLWIKLVVNLASFALYAYTNYNDFLPYFFFDCILLVCLIAIYSQDDRSDQCCLDSKPFMLKKVENHNNHY